MKSSFSTRQLAFKRQQSLCCSCGTKIHSLKASGKVYHEFGEIVHAHHINPLWYGGTNELDNCVIICQSSTILPMKEEITG